MKAVIIGHRGTGKTSFLKRLSSYYGDKKISFLDLDAEIEKSKKIDLIFSEDGEEAFRRTEQTTFKQIYSSNSSFVISLGAGFNLSELPSDVLKIWVRRSSDKSGRIFLDRPRLNTRLTPLEEFLSQFEFRNLSYMAAADFIYDLPEGLDKENLFENSLFDAVFGFKHIKNKSSQFFAVTLLPSHLEKLDFLIPIFLSLGINLFEVRDDLLSEDQIKVILDKVPAKNILYSRRDLKKESPVLDAQLLEQIKIDFEYALMSKAKSAAAHQLDSLFFKKSKNIFISTHSLIGRDLDETLNALGGFENVKLALHIDSLEEIKKILLWQKAQPHNRSFLPISKTGKWQWLRKHTLYSQPIHFIKYGEGSAADQITIYDFLSQLQNFTFFAAVLGSPIEHSQTPLEQQEFFNSWQMPIYKIDIHEKDWHQTLSFLYDLGLRASAVTSPLKKLACASCKKIKTSFNTDAINTLVSTDGTWTGTNTDIDGLKKLLKSIAKTQSTFVWGGGGTIEAIKNSISNTYFFSSRSGLLRTEAPVQPPSTCDALLWAAPPYAHLPPPSWAPSLVVDLNYREDSLAREYALNCNSKYISGLEMFKEQALKQRDFWQGYLKDLK